MLLTHRDDPSPERETGAAEHTALIQRMAIGDETALAELYDACADAVHALVLRMVRDERAAEELVEAVFWRAWEQAKQFTTVRSTAEMWLLSLARVTALDHLCTQGRNQLARYAGDLHADLQPTIRDLLSSVNATERAARVATVLRDLPADARHVLELAYFDGLDLTGIAERLGLQLGIVTSHARSALCRLRDGLDAMHGSAR